MKLKKIASLMLAGIMAVSMLAACGEGTGNNNGGASSSEQTGSSSAATVLQDKLSGDARRIVKTAAANSNLDAALKNAVDTYFNYSDLYYSIAFDDVLFLKNDVCDTNNKINKAVVDAMNAKDSVEKLVDTNDKTTVAVEVYAVNASVSDTEALEMLAAKISSYLASRPEKSADVGGSNYDYSYTISASIETREFDTVGTVKYGVKYIAVAVTQNVTRV